MTDANNNVHITSRAKVKVGQSFHDLGKMDRAVTTSSLVETDLLKNFHFTPIDTGSADEAMMEAKVLNELDDTENGKPKNYNVTKLTFQNHNRLPPRRNNGHIQRYNSTPIFSGPKTPSGMRNWRQNSNDYGNHGLLSPHEQQPYASHSPQNSYYNAMSPGFAASPSLKVDTSQPTAFRDYKSYEDIPVFTPQSASTKIPEPGVFTKISAPPTTSNQKKAPQQPSPQDLKQQSTPLSINTTEPKPRTKYNNNKKNNRKNKPYIRPHTTRPTKTYQQRFAPEHFGLKKPPISSRGNNHRHRNNKRNNGRFPQSARTDTSRFFNSGAQSYSVAGTPRGPPGPSGPIPTSCRLRDMAENDRHSFFPSSSTRAASYKSVTHPVPQVFSPGGQMHGQMGMPQMDTPALTPTSLQHRMSIKSTDSSKIRDVFLSICAGLEAEYGKENLIYPREIIWMIGPPGAGKSTLSRFLSEQRNFNSTPIVLREICQSVIAQNDGKLKIDEVVASLMKKLFNGDYENGVVVDGFVSITCARVVPFMFKYFHEIFEISQKNIHAPCFKFCVLYVNEDNSVRRQIVNYETGEKKSDRKFDAEEGRKLYRKFLKRTQQVVELIEMHFSFHLIDANGTLAQVQMVASTEIASDTNGALIHDATLVKALSPAANPKRRNNNWQRRQSGSSGSSFRSNSTRSHSHVNISASPRNTHKSTDFRLQPKQHPVTFANNLSVDITSHLEQVDDREVLSGLRQAVLDIVYGNTDGKYPANKLPAQKMETLNSVNYEQLSSDYVIRPYVKGTHAMLYWASSGKCYLIDRRFQFFTIRGNAYTAAHIGEGLIDGVLVVDSEDNVVFVAHDCATHQSRRLKDCWFNQRIHECRSIVQNLNEEKNGDETVHLVFLESMVSSNIHDLIDMIQIKEDGSGRTLVIDERQIPTHGFSFVPDKTGFHSQKGSRTFTWNFLEDTSRDFKVKAPYESNQVVLYASSKNADTVFQRAQFSEEDQTRFSAIVEEAVAADLNENFIVSCQFSKAENLWVPKKLQPGKNRANSTNSVNDSTVAWQNRLSMDGLLEHIGALETSL